MTKIGNVQLKMGGILLCHLTSPGPSNGWGLFSSEVGHPCGSRQPDSPAALRRMAPLWQAPPGRAVLDAEGFLSPHPGFLRGPG